MLSLIASFTRTLKGPPSFPSTVGVTCVVCFKLHNVDSVCSGVWSRLELFSFLPICKTVRISLCRRFQDSVRHSKASHTHPVETITGERLTAKTIVNVPPTLIPARQERTRSVLDPTNKVGITPSPPGVRPSGLNERFAAATLLKRPEASLLAGDNDESTSHHIFSP